MTLDHKLCNTRDLLLNSDSFLHLLSYDYLDIAVQINIVTIS